MRTLLVLVLVGFCLIRGGEACAHAVLLETNPADRGVVQSAPGEIVLRFNESVAPIVLEIRSNRGGLVPADVQAVDQQIHLVPRAPLGNGGYIVSYRVTSADSHPVAGSFLFAVGQAPAEWASATPSAPSYSKWNWAAAVDRALFLMAACVAVGAVLFGFAVGGGRIPHRLIVPASILGFATSLVGIFVQGGVLLDATDAAPFDLQIWKLGVESTRGWALSLAAVGFGLLLTRTAFAQGVGAAAVIASFVLSGHAATATPTWIAIPTLLLHVAVVAFWLGSLMPLLAALDTAASERESALGRFSDMAIIVVPQLLVAGAILAILQVRTFDALFGSAYSLFLLVKLMLVGLLLTLAACNRWILMPEMRDGVAGHVTRLRYTIFSEIALGAAVLVVTAFLSQTVPPRSLLEQQNARAEGLRDAGRTTLVVTDAGKALISVNPARAGWNLIQVRLLSGDDVSFDPKEVAIDLSNADARIEPLRRTLVPKGDGWFELNGPELAVPGRWTLRIDALIDDFTKAIFETEVRVN